MLLIALLSALRPLLLLSSFTYVLASTAHLYMLQIFTHYLTTIICDILVDVCCVYNNKQLFHILFYMYGCLPFICCFCKCFCYHISPACSVFGSWPFVLPCTLVNYLVNRTDTLCVSLLFTFITLWSNSYWCIFDLHYSAKCYYHVFSLKEEL